jgi:hypothetical protein
MAVPPLMGLYWFFTEHARRQIISNALYKRREQTGYGVSRAENRQNCLTNSHPCTGEVRMFLLQRTVNYPETGNFQRFIC